MKIVGVGCGPGLLTIQAAAAIKAATLIVGSDRAISLVRDEISPGCVVKEIDDYHALRTLPEEAVILSTGDPMISGLGYLPGEVIPGISSVQLGAARLHIPLTRLLVLSAHGRGHAMAIETAGEEIEKGRSVCLITDPGFDISRITERLALHPDVRIIICQDIGYQDEKIITGTIRTPPEPTSGMYILFLLPEET